MKAGAITLGGRWDMGQDILFESQAPASHPQKRLRLLIDEHVVVAVLV